MSNKEKYLKNEHKIRNTEKRSLQHKNHGNTAAYSNKSSEREAKHLKTAIRRCGDWTEHVSSSGKHYYFYIKTSTSQWEKPKDWDDSHSVEMKHRKPPSKVAASIKPSNRQIDQKSSQNQPTKSTSSGGCHDNNDIDKDFRRSPQRHIAADRDYRSAKMTSSATRDVDLRKEAMMTSSTAAGGKTRGKHVTSSSDRDYRQPMMTSSSGNCSDYDTTTIGSNGQQLLPSNESRDVSSEGVMTSLHMDKPATGEFFDYSNWDGIRPPLKSPSSVNDVTTAAVSHIKTSNIKNENVNWLSSDNSALMTSTSLNNNSTVTSSHSTSSDVIMSNGATDNKANSEVMTSSGKRVRLSTDTSVTSSVQEIKETEIKEETAATEEVMSSSNSVISVSAFVSGRRFFDSSLIQHLHNWPSLSHEREAHRSSMDSQRISMTSSILDCDLLKAKSSVRSLEISRNIHEHRIRKIREHMKDADSLSTSTLLRFERNGNDVITNTSSSSASSNHIDVTAHKLKSSEASA